MLVYRTKPFLSRYLMGRADIGTLKIAGRIMA